MILGEIGYGQVAQAASDAAEGTKSRLLTVVMA
jgi:hypothetical protein